MKNSAYKEMYDNELTHAWYIATRRLLTEYVTAHLQGKEKILDVGCGTGGTIVALNAGGFQNVIGIDNNLAAIHFCQKRGIKNVRLGSVNKIPFENGVFKAVLCMDVLYHQGVDVKVALKEFNRVLKKDGVLYIQEPAYKWLSSKHDRAIETQNRFTRKEIELLLKESGFRSLNISYYNMFLLPLIAAKRFWDKSSQDHHSDVFRLSPIFNKAVLKTMILEGMILKKINLPFGLSVIATSRK